MNVAANITLDEAFACWLWTGKLDKDGYGQVWRGKRPSYAHRVVYELEVGPIANGRVLDHACRRRNCVAPHHLEPVDKDENERRKSPRYRLTKLLRCKEGHDLTITRAMTPEGGVTCRTCNHEALRTPPGIAPRRGEGMRTAGGETQISTRNGPLRAPGAPE